MTRSNVYDERFGDLRSLLGQKPSALGFARQCRAIEQMWELEPERVNQELVPYMERALEGWPDELRVHPIFWLRRWYPSAKVEFTPVSLTRVLNLEQQRLGAALIEALAQLPAWHGVLSLNLAGNLLDAEAIKRLAKIPLTQLRYLNLSQNPLGSEGVRDLIHESAWAKGLRQLDMWATGCEFDGGVALALRGLGVELERLNMSAAELSSVSQAALRERFGARVVFS